MCYNPLFDVSHISYLWEKSPIQKEVSMSATVAIVLRYQCWVPGLPFLSVTPSDNITWKLYQFFSWSLALSTRTLAGSKTRSPSVGEEEM